MLAGDVPQPLVINPMVKILTAAGWGRRARILTEDLGIELTL